MGDWAPCTQTAGQDGCSIYVSNLTAMLDIDELRTIFRNFGRIKMIEVPPRSHPNQASTWVIIQYQTPAEATAGLAMDSYLYQNRQLLVSKQPPAQSTVLPPFLVYSLWPGYRSATLKPMYMSTHTLYPHMVNLAPPQVAQTRISTIAELAVEKIPVVATSRTKLRPLYVAPTSPSKPFRKHRRKEQEENVDFKYPYEETAILMKQMSHSHLTIIHHCGLEPRTYQYIVESEPGGLKIFLLANVGKRCSRNVDLVSGSNGQEAGQVDPSLTKPQLHPLNTDLLDIISAMESEFSRVLISISLRTFHSVQWVGDEGSNGGCQTPSSCVQD
ncbi:hypothetical protein SeLEV6574_g01385 [Synchytrium endobioticum]|uniref:RRM domain-containing protein n=1 Tax=Synchytrium endobioticum TaxID=286115 RepID=A0A507DDA6_9FUNG|nr:hypothetical protein SeLEV6574_g01385 [Synchytrium endobioticum]